ncbi:MAG TPA: hypothetical protein VES19_03585 [Candidatus Limnocylindrales bacterium]|nr:hypothetical protein [Candidatus Limnocylindrales bacterium]
MSRRAPRPVAAVLVLVACIGLAAVVVLTGAPRPAPAPVAPMVPSPSTGVPDTTRFDADGIPHAIGGAPILRGTAIANRAARRDPSAFLVAGWATLDPIASCAPDAGRCDFTSLVDSPGAPSTGAVTLDTPAGSSFSFDWTRQWAGGFYVLRVRAACRLGVSTCLVVDESVQPTGETPSTADGYGADGLPLRVDGHAVLRGDDMGTSQALAWDTLPVWVAGRAEPVDATGASCPDPVTWDEHPCPAIQLVDGAPGALSTASGPVLTAATWGLQAAWSTDATWPGGLVVLRAKASRVLGFVPRPGAATPRTPAPMPSLAFSGWAYSERVVDIAGLQVRWGRQISGLLASGPGETFLVTGAVEHRPCPTCIGGEMTVLVEPPVAGAVDGGTSFTLLRADGTSFSEGSRMVWTDPAGVVVLEVRRYGGECPDGVPCSQALQVERVATPPD